MKIAVTCHGDPRDIGRHRGPNSSSHKNRFYVWDDINSRASKNPGLISLSVYRMHELVASPLQVKFKKIEKKDRNVKRNIF